MWHVKLACVDAKDYEVLLDVLGDKKIYSQHLQLNGQEHIEYFFVPDDQNIQSAPEALSKAVDEIKPLCALLKIFGLNKNKIDVQSACEIHPDGTKTLHIHFSDVVFFGDGIEVYSNGSLLYSSEEKRLRDMKDIYMAAKLSQDKIRLLNYMGKEINWVNAYHIYEILKHNYIKESDLKKMPELATFAHTANSPLAIGEDARHAVQTNQNPRVIADLQKSYEKLVELSKQYLVSP